MVVAHPSEEHPSAKSAPPGQAKLRERKDRTGLAVAPRISKWVAVAAPRVPLLILGMSRLRQPSKAPITRSGDTALSDGSQCGIRVHILFKKLQECVFSKVLCLVALLVNKKKGLEPRPWAALQPTGQSLVRWCVCDGVYLWGGASNLQSTESCIMLA
jgi:hypothetical protein